MCFDMLPFLVSSVRIKYIYIKNMSVLYSSRFSKYGASRFCQTWLVGLHNIREMCDLIILLKIALRILIMINSSCSFVFYLF